MSTILNWCGGSFSQFKHIVTNSETKCKGKPKYDLPNASINFGSLGDLRSENMRGIYQ